MGRRAAAQLPVVHLNGSVGLLLAIFVPVAATDVNIEQISRATSYNGGPALD